MNRLTKIFIFIFVLLVSFAFTNSAKSYTYATSTPCGVRLTWESAETTQCITLEDMGDHNKCINYSNKKAEIIIFRTTTYTSNFRNWPVIFSGVIYSLPSYVAQDADNVTSNLLNRDLYSYSNQQYQSYTDLTAIPGNKYYYHIEPLYGEAPSDANIIFQRPELNYFNKLAGYNVVSDVDGAVFPVNNSFPPRTPTYMSYSEGLAEYGYEFSNSCPFVQTPGNTSTGFNLTLYEPLGSKISDLTCNENKYAFKNSTTGWFFNETINNADDKFDIIQRYGFSMDKFKDLYSVAWSNNYEDYENQEVTQYYGGYDINMTGSVGFNFYREVCKETQSDLFGTTCTFSKVPTADYTLTQPTTGYNLVEFNNNYTPPPDTDDYLVKVYYRVTAVNQYGAESWPVEFNWVAPLPTCSNDCIDPNTIDPNKIFTIKNVLLSNDFLGTSKVLGWNNADNELGQYTYNALSTNQEWYIKPSNESKYAILVSKQDGKALSTDGYIDWGWTHFGEKLYSLYTRGEDMFPGYIKGYENIYTYKGKNMSYDSPWGGYEYSTGYKIKKYKEYNPTDDSQKWCIAPEKTSQWNEEGTDYTMVNTGNYAFINKNVQAPMKLLNIESLKEFNPFLNTEGFLVWLNPFEGGYYKNDSIEYYYPGQEGSDLWQLDIPTTTTQSCLLLDGRTIPEGATTTYYKSNYVTGIGCDDSSNIETRTCTNGTLTGTATSTSCTEYCVNPTNGDDVDLNGTYSTTTEVTKECKKYTYEYTCTDKEDGQGAKMVLQTPVNSTNIEGCTPVDDNPEPKTLNTARLVPSIVDIGKPCFGKIDKSNDLGYLSLNSSTTTCGIYGILDTSYQTALDSSKDPTSSNVPEVYPGDYKIICKDTALPNNVTAVSRTLKCVLNPTVKEI